MLQRVQENELNTHTRNGGVWRAPLTFTMAEKKVANQCSRCLCESCTLNVHVWRRVSKLEAFISVGWEGWRDSVHTTINPRQRTAIKTSPLFSKTKRAAGHWRPSGGGRQGCGCSLQHRLRLCGCEWHHFAKLRAKSKKTRLPLIRAQTGKTVGIMSALSDRQKDRQTGSKCFHSKRRLYRSLHA